MKRAIPLEIILLTLCTAGCHDSFSPKIPFQESPVLFCILNATYTRLPAPQEAVVSRTYDVDGINPSAPHADPAVSDVRLTLRVNARQYEFSERMGPRSDSSRYADPGTYAHPQVFLYPLDTVSIRAILPDGRTLNAKTFVPGLAGLDTRPLYPHGFTTKVNRWTEGDEFAFDWDDGNYEEHLFFPKLSLVCSVKTGTRVVGRTFEIPLRYVSQNGQQTPVYPSYQTSKTCAFPLDVIDEAMRRIGSGKTDSTVITVLNIVFDLTEFDFALSRYYASVNGYLDRYSVRTDESIYSNISGGIGLLGVRMDSKFAFPMDRRYVESFGYAYAGPN